VLGLQAEYLQGPWSLRSEYAHETVKDDLVVNGLYVEAAYHVTNHWQAAAQYDHLTSDLPGADVSAAPSLLRHTEFALGLNYWLGPALVFKLEYHHVDGNRFAGPEPASYSTLIPSGLLIPRRTWFSSVLSSPSEKLRRLC
jgi:phosphate-selective porin